MREQIFPWFKPDFYLKNEDWSLKEKRKNCTNHVTPKIRKNITVFFILGPNLMILSLVSELHIYNRFQFKSLIQRFMRVLTDDSGFDPLSLCKMKTPPAAPEIQQCTPPPIFLKHYTSPLRPTQVIVPIYTCIVYIPVYT